MAELLGASHLIHVQALETLTLRQSRLLLSSGRCTLLLSERGYEPCLRLELGKLLLQGIDYWYLRILLRVQRVALLVDAPLMQLQIDVLAILEQARLRRCLCAAGGEGVIIFTFEHVNCVWRLGELYRLKSRLQTMAVIFPKRILLDVRGCYQFLSGIPDIRPPLLQFTISLKV